MAVALNQNCHEHTNNIDPSRAAALVEAFGETLPQAILEQDEGVVEIIGEDHAITAAAVLETRLHEAVFLSWLHSINAKIHPTKAIRLARAWGRQGIEAAQQNPYLLLVVSDWQTVDRIGRALGILREDTRREIGAVEAALTGKDCLGSGSTLMTTNDALTQTIFLPRTFNLLASIEFVGKYCCECDSFGVGASTKQFFHLDPRN